MIDYNLAVSLKDAGFPQKIKGMHILPSGEVLDYPLSNTYYCPTLLELIETCGVGFLSLTRTSFTACRDGSLVRSVDEPNIAYVANAPIDNIEGWGLTPEEAVANLWLKLNEK